MNILFITSNRLGDAVLSTGLLDHITNKHPKCRITVVCGALPASLFEGLPNLVRIIILTKKKYHKHWIDLWFHVANTKWDMVIDLRNSAVSRLIRSKQLFLFSNHVDKNQHKVEQNAAIMGLSPPPSPHLWFSDKQKEHAAKLIPEGGPVLGIGPTANWIGKTWPTDRFIEIVHKLTESNGALPNAHVAIFAAAGEESAAYEVLNSVPDNRRIDLIAKTDPGTAAASLSRCALYIGNDSGLMHCAAATGIPTVGLFGPSHPHLYSPWGKRTVYAKTTETFDELINFKGYNPKTLDKSLMLSLDIDTVMKAVSSII